MKKHHSREQKSQRKRSAKKERRQMKSKAVKLGLLSSIAMTYAACNSQQPPQTPNPYDGYNYYGHASDPGMVYSHYDHGSFNWFLLSRMFNGYGYYPPMYRPFYRGGVAVDSMGSGGYHYYGHGGYYPGYYSMRTSSSGGIASSASVSRGGFGSSGYAHGGYGRAGA